MDTSAAEVYINKPKEICCDVFLFRQNIWIETNLGVGSCLSINVYFLHTYLYSQVCLMSNRIVLKANKMMIMVLMKVSWLEFAGGLLMFRVS